MKFENFYNQYTLYVDLDSVLCDFLKAFIELGVSNGKSYADYKSVVGDDEIHKQVDSAGGVEFWVNMEWMPDGKTLWNYVKNFTPTILSKPTEYDDCREGKRIWVNKELGQNIPLILEKRKEIYATPNAILIDDWPDNIDKWTKAGGISIFHTSANDTIKQLKQLGL